MGSISIFFLMAKFVGTTERMFFQESNKDFELHIKAEAMIDQILIIYGLMIIVCHS